jgi:hypothetical protein
MPTPVSPATQVQPQAPVQNTPARPAPAQSTAPPSPKDTVTLSAAALLNQELTETSVQTATEASHGDIQARNLLARETADKKLLAGQ